MKVLHAPRIIANNSVVISKYLRRLNIDSIVISYFRTWMNFEGDINLDLDNIPFFERNKIIRKFFEDNLDFFRKFDVIHYHFLDTLTSGTSSGGWQAYKNRDFLWELKFFKNMGKKIVVSCWGSDVRNNSKIIYYQLKFENPNLELPYPPLNTLVGFQKLWEFSQYADAIVCGDSEILKHVPYGIMIPIPIDLEPLKVVGDCDGKGLSVVHAPSNHWVKGSKIVLEVLEKIKNLFPKVEIRLISGTPHKEALKLYRGTGLGIDQINFSFGLVTLEMMYFGRRVITTLVPDEFIKGDPKLQAPVSIVHDKPSLFEEIKKYLLDPSQIKPEKYRKFVIEHFSAERVAKEYKKLYELLLDEEKLPVVINKEWFREFNLVLSGKKLAEEYYSKVSDVLLEKRDFQRFWMEYTLGQGLYNDTEMNAKLAAFLRLLNRDDRASNIIAENRKNEEFNEHYQRALKLLNLKK